MKIAIDMQGAQAENKERGIGRYTLSFAQALVCNRGEHEVVLGLNGLFPGSIEPIRAAFKRLLPQENIRVWHAPGPLTYNDPDSVKRRKVAEIIREGFFTSLNPSIVIVCSMFEGLVDDAVTSIGCLSACVPTASVLYDLIPLIHKSSYLDDPSVASWYEDKLSNLCRADLLLSISESSRQEAISHLRYPADKIVNISSGVNTKFCKKQVEHNSQSAIRTRYGLDRPFLMYTGGIDHRKNIESLIRGYACLLSSLRSKHQLAIICSINPKERTYLENFSKINGLFENDVILTGYVPEEDLIALYNMCKLFVFPSWHEGFGLPVLEAMACGCVVIGANTSSVPEVIGQKDALFDPFNVESITAKMEQVLSDDMFKEQLKEHSLVQSRNFSWDKTAQKAISAIERLQERKKSANSPHHSNPRPRLAYISPLPPERSGISDYSAELLPELFKFYNIEVVVSQETVSDPWIRKNFPIRSVEWFKTHAIEFDRILYHFGNSQFHQHMFSLLENSPGVVVLHDFFLSGAVSYIDINNIAPGFWIKELYNGHGYAAVYSRFHEDTSNTNYKYPCNQSVFSSAHGIIVHSENSLRLIEDWYGIKAYNFSCKIPLLRNPVYNNDNDRNRSRDKLRLNKSSFVVCSFGMLGNSKLNHRLLDAWLSSSLSEDANCVLIFVGQNDSGEYGKNLIDKIMDCKCSERVTITGWVGLEEFRNYLRATDLCIQLRSISRGETSAAVLDCMNYGIPTIVNANGSMADLSDAGVLKLPDNFTNGQLVNALTELRHNPNLRSLLSRRAREIIRTEHNPGECAEKYHYAIERFYNEFTVTMRDIVQAASNHLHPSLNNYKEIALTAESIDKSIKAQCSLKQLFVDISELVQRDAKSGIQRVTRNILFEWLLNPPKGYYIEPVYADDVQYGYRYARRFTLDFLGCPKECLSDEPISYYPGDIFIGLDLQHYVIPFQKDFYQKLRQQGVVVKFLVYDLLPVLMPQFFEPIGPQLHHNWLSIITQSDGALCISKAVADELKQWHKENPQKRHRPFKIDWFHLGADLMNLEPSKGLPKNAGTIIESIGKRPSFLMVGTLEPRKGHEQVLGAFEKLWQSGENHILVIVGKQGWMMDNFVGRLCKHPERDKHLFWLESISDEFLEKVYQASTCLIAASYGEGFGLPLIEAAQHNKPIIARDIPVFREVTGEHAFYFNSKIPGDLAIAITEWQKLYAVGRHPKSNNIHWLKWKESAAQLVQRILDVDPTVV